MVSEALLRVIETPPRCFFYWLVGTSSLQRECQCYSLSVSCFTRVTVNQTRAIEHRAIIANEQFCVLTLPAYSTAASLLDRWCLISLIPSYSSYLFPAGPLVSLIPLFDCSYRRCRSDERKYHEQFTHRVQDTEAEHTCFPSGSQSSVWNHRREGPSWTHHTIYHIIVSLTVSHGSFSIILTQPLWTLTYWPCRNLYK